MLRISLGEPRRQRQRVVAVGDRAAERRLLRALGIDVDPLVVAGGVGERVDVVLGDLVPVGDAELLALGPLELVESRDRSHGPELYPARAMAAPLLVTDAPHLLYRAFFALPDSITDADGAPVNALLGSVNQALWCVERYKPRAVVMCFGQEAAAYRVEAFPGYHADRPPMPDPLARPVGARAGPLRGARLDVVDHAALEADDLHALAGPRRGGGGRRAAILTGDRDLFQCATEHTSACCMQRARQEGPDDMGPEVVEEFYGVDARAGAGLHRAARRPVRRAPGRQGHRRQDRGRPAAAQGRPRARDPRRDPREALGAAGADRAGRRAAHVPRHRHAAHDRRRPRPPTAPTDYAAGAAAASSWG